MPGADGPKRSGDGLFWLRQPHYVGGVSSGRLGADRAGANAAAVRRGRGNLFRLAVRNAAKSRPQQSYHRPGRLGRLSDLAMGAFHVDPAGQQPQRNDGTGGFALVAQTDVPVYQDLNTAEGRKALGFAPATRKRLRPGKPSPCGSSRATTPVAAISIGRCGRGCWRYRRADRAGASAWNSSAAATAAEKANPWLLLKADRGVDSTGRRRIPVVLETNTAVYSLHLAGEVGEIYQFDNGRGNTIPLEVVGLLSNSILQGDLLIDEQQLLRAFPEISGYQFFLVDGRGRPHGRDPGRAPARDWRLRRIRATQQPASGRIPGGAEHVFVNVSKPGRIGAFAGHAGIGRRAVRNLAQRRRELALLRATGIAPRMLARMVFWETIVLLGLGLAGGVLAALIAVLPHLLSGGAHLPWVGPVSMLAAVVVTGVAAALLAVRAILSAPLLPALRGE